jgi:hypothetical protein
VRISLDDGEVEEIVMRSEVGLAQSLIESNAIARDGRIAVQIAESWFWPTGILDPCTGRIERAWPGINGDMSSGWIHDGRLVTGASFLTSSLWRFVPESR